MSSRPAFFSADGACRALVNHVQTSTAFSRAPLAAIALALVACGGPRVSYHPHTAEAATRAPSTEEPEVLLDHAPTDPYVVAGEFSAMSYSNLESIELMKQRAKAAGLDGIYWIDCTSPCSGHCTAKGYVYRDRDVAKHRLGDVAVEK
jgi:hypothetical protein